MRFLGVFCVFTLLASLSEGMRIFQDVFLKKDVFSEAYEYELVDDSFYFVYGKWVLENNEIDDSKIGGNRPKELDEDSENTYALKENLVSTNKLEEAVAITNLVDYEKHFKKYTGKLMTTGRLSREKARDVLVPAFAKHILPYEEELTYYAVEDDGYDMEGVPIVLRHIPAESGRQEDETLVLIVIKEAVEPIRV